MQESIKAPPKVADLATQRGLGTLVAVHTGHNAVRIILFAVGLFAVGIGIAALGVFVKFLVVLGLAIVFFGFVSLVFVVRVLVKGIEASFVYAGGFVLREKRVLRAVTWPEVTELRRVRAAAVMPAHPKPEAVLWHKAVLRDGALVDVGSDKVSSRVEEIAVAARVPVSG
jgi:hypothetical protein